MNDGDLPVAFVGPLGLRVPRQLGYKSVKFLTGLMVTDSAKGFVSPIHLKSPQSWLFSNATNFAELAQGSCALSSKTWVSYARCLTHGVLRTVCAIRGLDWIGELG